MNRRVNPQRPHAHDRRGRNRLFIWLLVIIAMELSYIAWVLT